MILNLTKRIVISKEPRYAVGFLERGRGMIGRNFSNFDAMVFEKCNCIHTIFMSQKIDVLFLTGDNVVCMAREGLRPWVPFARCAAAVAVIELPDGTIGRTGTREGDILDLKAELSQNGRDLLAGKNFMTEAETAVPFKRV